MAHLVLQDVDILSVDGLHEVLAANSLAPVTTSASAEAVSEPQGLVVVVGGAGSAAGVVVVLVEEATAGLGALRDALAVGVGVDVEAAGVTLEQALVLDGPADDVHLDRGVGEVVVAVDPLEPLLVLGVDDAGDLGALGGGEGRGRLPSDTHVDGAGSS